MALAHAALAAGSRLVGAPGSMASCGGDGVGFDWRGRWGWWSQDGVLILASCVGVFEVSAISEPHSASSDVTLLDGALREMREFLQAELPQNAALADVHWMPRPGAEPRQKGARVAILADMNVCHQLRRVWRNRSLCGGSVIATWSVSFDTASDDQARRVTERLERAGVQHQSILIELPPRWFAQEIRSAEFVKLSRGSHWFNFAELFGQVQEVALYGACNGNGEDAVFLLVSFVTSEGASNMYMGLSDRYIYNQHGKQDDIHPVICMTGDSAVLRERLLRTRKPVVEVARFQPDNIARNNFVLNRCGRGIPDGALCSPPEQVVVGGSRRKLAVGREDTCDVPIRHPHISKTHATLVMQEIDASQWMLMLRDSSSNGTWVNGRRLQPAQGFIQLRPGDRVSFLQPIVALDMDPMTYEVQVTGANVAATLAPPFAQPLATPLVHPVQAPAQMPPQHLSTSVPAAMPAMTSPGFMQPCVKHPDATGGIGTLESKVAMSRPRSRSRSRAQPSPQLVVAKSEDAAACDRALGAQLRERLATAPPHDMGNAGRPLGIGDWLRRYGLQQYETALASHFDNTQQIVNLYARNVKDFFQDYAVTDMSHKQLFTQAILENR
eukprot:TRINITY_DN22003_c0_g1_i1.p1 TRINITY_DN22003_c0_g1~~TRINITY_DN22003_c0_g1_i1.p1  ORF type:complete len:658 (+),score=47.63 TRINITY_DN22003_c0_g1_i1:140-1975(+)